MSVGSYLELYLAALGWHFYETLWSSLLNIGLLYIPFIAMAVRAWIESYEAAGAEGAERNIRAAEVSIATMFTVVMLAGSPFIPLQPSGLVYTRPCSNDAAKGGASNTTYDSVFTALGISEITGHVPVWWYGVMAAAGGVVNAAVAAIPCQNDFRLYQYKLENSRIKDPQLRRELQLFTHDCWYPARMRLFDSKQQLPSGYDPSDIDWPGSQFFLDTSSYYGVNNINLATRASEEIPGFPFDPQRDTEYDTEHYPAPQWGRPECKDWWEAQTYGIRDRLIQEIEVEAWAQTQGWVIQLMNAFGWDARKTEDAALRSMWTIEDGRLSMPVTAGLGDAAGGRLARAGATVGGWWESVFFQSKMYAIREAAPVGQAVLLMLIFALMPFVLLFGEFSVGTLLTLTITLFAVRFLTFLWAAAVWLDNTLQQALNPTGWFDFAADKMDYTVSEVVIDLVTGTMFTIVPVLWVGMLGWAGYHAGVGLNSFLEGTNSSAAATGSGFGNALSLVKNRFRELKPPNKK
ncbi:conjugal transfer protein TraG N-terminal domain-containing protein [Methylocaldum sp. GT1BB]|uniref:conjugal transfer protein TraG N-terminal domain-containing protein n=1 Tax=Methylocaldum sp. GT1BB TaxID=3438963 RepID=UPI003DA1503E